MKFTILLLLFCGIFSFNLYAQNKFTVKGEVTDTSAKSYLSEYFRNCFKC
jgi:hypothetical protein